LEVQFDVAAPHGPALSSSSSSSLGPSGASTARPPIGVARPALDLREPGGVPGATIAERVEERIRALLDAEVSRWSSLDGELVEPLTSLARLALGGGKRLRPWFCFWAFVGAGGDADDPRVVDVAAALELLHCFALVHDDVMDDAAERRGQPAVHVDYAARHQGSGWRGEARRFGDGVAILVGDLAFVYADHLMTGLPPAVHAVFTELRLEVNVGQYLDLLGSVRGEVDLGAIQRVCRYKSGKYTVERPLHMGAALAGGLRRLAAPFSAYGLPLGEAFQLRDDLLGAFGDPGLLGKPVGGDLREGKPTFLFALARRRAAGADLAFLLDRYGAADLSAEDIAELRGIFERTGARAALERRVEALCEEAVRALEGCPLENGAGEALAGLARYVVERDH
jgi:geranylgeranyl diphosphate synthase type I